MTIEANLDIRRFPSAMLFIPDTYDLFGLGLVFTSTDGEEVKFIETLPFIAALTSPRTLFGIVCFLESIDLKMT
tara:strand:+ start:168 stop:389 length:222 start_codon:yes stop_codon:yes gene_type:complete